MGDPYKIAEAYAEPEKQHKEFKGWYTDSVIEEGTLVEIGTTPVTVATPHTLYAHWKDVTVQVSFNPNGGTFPGGSSDPIEIDEVVGAYYAFPDQPSNDYQVFAGWWTTGDDPKQIIPGVSIVPDVAEGFEVEAHWDAVPTVDVAFNSMEGS